MVVEEPSPNNVETVEKNDSSTLVSEPAKIFTVESEFRHPTSREVQRQTINLKK